MVHKGRKMLLGGTGAVLLLVLSFWVWQYASRELAGRGCWSVPMVCVAGVAGAQLVLLRFVVDAVYRRDSITEAMRLLATLVCLLAVVGALALGLAGR